MTEQELRMLVREAIARYAQGGHGTTPRVEAPPPRAVSHPSHRTLAIVAEPAAGGMCVIEPAVTCNHCGYCKSLGY
jgi:hypothetical protein